MNRRALLETLTEVSNALAGSDVIPILHCFWFEDSMITAYNDVIAVGALFKTGFTGAVHDTILPFLRSSTEQEVTFEPIGKDLVVKLGKAHYKVPIFADKFVFKMPKPGNAPSIGIGKQLIHALKTCLLSVSDDSSRPEHLGITVIPRGDKLDLFSTDSKTLTWVRSVPAEIKNNPERVILSAEFCQQLIALATKKQFETIELRKEYVPGARRDVGLNKLIAIARASDGTILFGRLVESPRPLDFGQIVTAHLPKDHRNRTIPIPVDLKPALERAVFIESLDLEKTRTQIVVKDGIATFSTRSKRGDGMTDELPLKHEDVQLSIEAWRLRNVCDHFARMLLKEDVAIFTSEKGGAVHIIAARE